MRADEGGSLSGEEAAALLGTTLAELEGMVQAFHVVSWIDDQGQHRFPNWQFSRGGMLPGVKETLQLLYYRDEGSVMGFFLCQRFSLGRKRTLDLLRSGEVAKVLMYAGAEAE